MKKIPEIQEQLELIQPKLDINAIDFSKAEKEALAEAYFHVTKQSTGFGRSLDTGCESCVVGAANIIRNYQALVIQAENEETEMPKAPLTVVTGDDGWKATNKTIAAYAATLEGFKLTKEMSSKEDKIAAIEAHLATLVPAAPVEEPKEDLEFTREQLLEALVAKTGKSLETFEGDTDDELLEQLTELETDEEDGLK